MISVPLGLLLAGVGIYLANAAARPISDAPTILAGPRHPVTKEMWEESKRWTSLESPQFEFVDVKGKHHSLQSLAKAGPTFLYFVLDGCPCSIDAEPLFQRLYGHLDGRAQFIAITSSNDAKAKEWRSNWSSPYPVVAMPGLETMKSFSVERSVYSVLIDQKGRIVRLWPGYSASMLKELNSEVFRLAGEHEKPFDPLYAPKEMASGCEF